MQYWLMKSEPGVYSIDDLRRDGKTSWEGVRNYQARNIMRDTMKVGDLALFYHSNALPPGVAGIGRICRAAYPDSSAWTPRSPYHDPRSTPDNPVWVAVDLAFVEKLPRFVDLAALKAEPRLKDLMVTRRGSRLSVQPVSENDFRCICRMGGLDADFGKPKAK